MKSVIPVIIQVLIGIILIGKISNWFLNYSDEVNKILDAVMFTVLGIFYLSGGLIYKKLATKIIFLVSGLYLIVMNFVGDFGLKSVIGIICLLTPMILLRLVSKHFENDEVFTKNK